MEGGPRPGYRFAEVPGMFALLLAACGGEQTLEIGEPAPDFSLVDVNPGSVSYEERVSPRDELGQVSAWYFGHAT